MVMLVDEPAIPRGCYPIGIGYPVEGDLYYEPSCCGAVTKAGGTGNPGLRVILNRAMVPDVSNLLFNGNKVELISDEAYKGFAVPTLDNCEAYLSVDGSAVMSVKETAYIDRTQMAGRRWLVNILKPAFYVKGRCDSFGWTVYKRGNNTPLAGFNSEQAANEYAAMLGALPSLANKG